jgi:hypothetical protein
MDDELRAEVEKIARSPGESGRALEAKLGALRLLHRLDRKEPVTIPTDMDGRFHPGSREWQELDRGDSDQVRQQWLESWLADRSS